MADAADVGASASTVCACAAAAAAAAAAAESSAGLPAASGNEDPSPGKCPPPADVAAPFDVPTNEITSAEKPAVAIALGSLPLSLLA